MLRSVTQDDREFPFAAALLPPLHEIYRFAGPLPRRRALWLALGLGRLVPLAKPLRPELPRQVRWWLRERQPR
jgi:hypothetical protein